MEINEVTTQPCTDQRPGTAGLRKSVKRFQEPHYLANFIQSVFDTLPELRGARMVLGGDGRFYNREAANIILRLAAANGVAETVMGREALLSTPAAAHLIQREDAAGGFLLTASHNPGGPDGDFGIKFNVRGGGQASAALTEKIYARSCVIDRYRIAAQEPPPFDREGQYTLGPMTVRVVDPVQAHADLLESCFDFSSIRQLLETGFRFRFDALHAVTGPYAEEIFQRRLGADASAVQNGQPQPDFGGGHPDPNPVDARSFFVDCTGPKAPDLGTASDGDGDRNMIVHPDGMVSPCDSLALIAAHHRCIPALADGLAGVARSMPTSRAVDAVAEDLGIPCYETPTGWRFFAGLLDSGRIRLCGEESFGTSSDHVREKDGLWAILAWLQILAKKGCSVGELLARHWQRYGRHYYQRQDYALETSAGEQIMARLSEQASRGHIRDEQGPLEIDSFAYTDPVSGESVSDQGIRAFTSDGGRIVFRLSGTGTQGATLRMYLEQYAPPDKLPSGDPGMVLAPLAERARILAKLATIAGKDRPDTMI